MASVGSRARVCRGIHRAAVRFLFVPLRGVEGDSSLSPDSSNALLAPARARGPDTSRRRRRRRGRRASSRRDREPSPRPKISEIGRDAVPRDGAVPYVLKRPSPPCEGHVSPLQVPPQGAAGLGGGDGRPLASGRVTIAALCVLSAAITSSTSCLLRGIGRETLLRTGPRPLASCASASRPTTRRRIAEWETKLQDARV